MQRQLICKNPSLFKTLLLQVRADPDRLTYRSLGMPLNFTQMQERRCPLEISDSRQFSARLANLGVSVRLTLEWKGRDHWLLVRQQRPDRGDTVLKLISGYVPAQEIKLPLLTAVQEVAEECLIETSRGWLAGRFHEIWLPSPYQHSLRYREDCHFQLSPLSGAARPVFCGDLPLLERPRAYVHLPTSSLQLVYDMRLTLPRQACKPSLMHADEHMEGNQLIASLAHSQQDLYLLPLEQDRPTGELFNLSNGQLKRCSSQGLWLAESFARQDGWLVREERIAWSDWLAQTVKPARLATR